jgi:hypothetical protein
MYAGGVLKQVDGLTYDRLTYFVRAGYLMPKKIRKKSLYYNDFSEADVELIKRVCQLASTYDVRTKAAFERARGKAKDPQLTLDLGAQPKDSVP